MKVEKDTPCTSILLAVERDTPCISALLMVDRDTPYACTAYSKDRYTLHVHTDYGEDGYTLHVHTASEGKGYTLHVYTAIGGEGYTLHIHTACGGKGYTLTSTLLVVKKDTPSRPHCWLWKVIHPHVHTAGGGKQFTMLTREKDTLSCPPLLVVEMDTALRSHRRYTLMSTLLTVEINTPSRSQPAGGGKGYTPTPTHIDCGFWKRKHPHIHTASGGGGKIYTFISKCRNAGKKLVQHHHIQRYST
jgi:hypothetical protein